MNDKHSKIKEIVSKELSCSAHSIDHIMRVNNLCNHIAKFEDDVDIDILTPAVLLHDIARVKEDEDDTGKVDHAILGSQMAKDILKDLGYDKEKIKKICHCIISHRYRSGYSPKSIEAKILFDGDKLDAIGAIGIGRSYMLAGQFKERIYLDVDLKDYTKENVTDNGRIKEVAKHSPNLEFEMKLKSIPNKLFTKKAKEIAKNRISYMEDFFKRISLEIKGEY